MTLYLAAVIIGFLLLTFIPFVPGLLELLWPKDATPLKISFEYYKDPRYFGRSFRKLLFQGMTCPVEVSRHEKFKVVCLKLHEDLVSGREENIKVLQGRAIIEDDSSVNEVIWAENEIIIGEKAQLFKEVYVKGDAHIEKGVTLRALACDSRMFAKPNLKVIRWIDAEQGIYLEGWADLGVSATTEGELRLSTACKFRRLYGHPVFVETRGTELPSNNKNNERVLKHYKERRIFIEDHEIPSGEEFDKDIIVRGDLKIGSNCVIKGSIKTHGRLEIGENVVVEGGCFSEGDIKVGRSSRIHGNIFSQGRIELGPGVAVGEKGKDWSVISRYEMVLYQGVVISGYVVAVGGGRTVS